MMERAEIEKLIPHRPPFLWIDRVEELEPGVRGWSEVHAADGYRLRCDRNRSGSREEMSFSEIAPPTR